MALAQPAGGRTASDYLFGEVMTFPRHPRCCHGCLPPPTPPSQRFVLHMYASEQLSTPGVTSSYRPSRKRSVIQYPVRSRCRGRNRRYGVMSRPGYFNEYKRANCDFTPPGLTWLFIQTQTTTLLPTNENHRLSTPRKWGANPLLGCVR